MTLTYALGVDDIVAFNQHFAFTRHKELVPRPMLVRGVTVKFAWQLFWWLVIFAATLRYGLIGGAVAVLVWYAVFLIQKPLVRLFLRRQVTRLYAAAPYDPLLGAHTLTLRDGTLSSQSESSRGDWSCSRILRVAEAPEYVFIYVGVERALVIPRRQVAPAELSLFLSSLRTQAPAAFPEVIPGNA